MKNNLLKYGVLLTGLSIIPLQGCALNTLKKQGIEDTIKVYNGPCIPVDIDVFLKQVANNIENVNLIFTNVSDDTVKEYDLDYKYRNLGTIFSEQSSNDLEDILSIEKKLDTSFTYGVVKSDRILKLMNKYANNDSVVLIDLVMQDEKGRNSNISKQYKFYEGSLFRDIGNDKVIVDYGVKKKLGQLVDIYSKELGKNKVKGVIHLNKSNLYCQFADVMAIALNNSQDMPAQMGFFYKAHDNANKILDEIFTHKFCTIKDVAETNMLYSKNIEGFIDWNDDEHQSLINKKLYEAVIEGKTSEKKPYLAIDFGNKKAVKQIIYHLKNSMDHS